MQLRLKLPLAFALALLLLAATALLGILMLRHSLVTYATVVQASVAHERAVKDLEITFKTQVQEWKNTLLRGQDAQQLQKYWGSFQQTEHEVTEAAKKLQATLPEGESKSLVMQFADAHAKMGEGYRKGYEAFAAANFAAAAGDAAVKGMDRAPAKLLEEAGKRIAANSAGIAAHASSQGQRAVLLSLGGMLFVTVVGVVFAMLFCRAIVRPLSIAQHVTQRIAQGDLEQPVTVKGKDELAALMQSLADMQVSLQKLVLQVRSTSDGISTASTQIASSNHDLSARTEQTAANLQQTASSIEELTGTVTQSADTARQASQLASSAAGAAQRGGGIVSEAVSSMERISASSQKIADIIGVIDGIAFQTNILALNAAVEAARAGEQGRGFAVVASEVRALAQRSAEAAKEIKALIGASVDTVESGSRLVNDAGAVMQEIVANVQRVSDLMGQIAAAAGEQRDGIGQVNTAVGNLDQMTQQNAALVEESAAAASSLRDQADRLSDLVAVFRVGQIESPRMV
jgi:methyl-accepting chemotaxis protein-1 (serine sensor receptor)